MMIHVQQSYILLFHKYYKGGIFTVALRDNIVVLKWY